MLDAHECDALIDKKVTFRVKCPECDKLIPMEGVIEDARMNGEILIKTASGYVSKRLNDVEEKS